MEHSFGNLEKMKAFGLALIVLAALGCGGSGNDSVSPYAGTYAGEWKIMSFISGAEPLDGGVMDIVISEKGKLSGRFTDASPFQEGTLSGLIRSNGGMSFNVEFESGKTIYYGQAQLEGNHLSGTFGEPAVGYVNFPSFDLTRQP